MENTHMAAIYAINNKQKISSDIFITLKGLFIGEKFILRKTYGIKMKGTKASSEIFLSRIEFRIYN
jgi:hypothetical protein